jgi:xanthine/uracil permease
MMQYSRTGNGMTGTRGASDRSVANLLGDLADETRMLVQQEIRLATAEMRHKAGRVGRSSGSAAAGGAILFAGMMVVLIGLAVGLAILLAPRFMPWTVAAWLSPLIIGLLVGFIGYALLQHGLHTISQTDWTPRRTVHSMRETTRWIHDRVM